MNIRMTNALLGLMLTVCSPFEASPRQQASMPRQDYDVQNVIALDALIRLGEAYDVPMGIVCDSNKIATMTVSASAPHATLEEALAQLMRQLPGYEWKGSRGVILVQPRQIPVMTDRMLLTIIPRITAKHSGVDHLSFLLFWELQRKLDPQGTSSGFMAVTHDGGQTIDYFDVANASVREILNEIVRKRKSAAWVVLPSINYVKGAPRDTLWNIVAYSDPPRPLSQLCCLNQEAFK